MGARLEMMNEGIATTLDDKTADGPQVEQGRIFGLLAQIENRFGRLAGEIITLLLTILVGGLMTFLIHRLIR
jgi:hypothetical protein